MWKWVEKRRVTFFRGALRPRENRVWKFIENFIKTIFNYFEAYFLENQALDEKILFYSFLDLFGHGGQILEIKRNLRVEMEKLWRRGNFKETETFKMKLFFKFLFDNVAISKVTMILIQIILRNIYNASQRV